MKRTRLEFLGILLSLSILIACASNPDSPPPAEGVRAEKGQVLVTDRLDVDFAAYQVTFLEIGADRCIPCKKMQPIMKEIAAEFAEDVQVVFYDVWKNPEPGRKYSIQLIPTQVFLDDRGKEFFRHEGFYPEAEIDTLFRKRGLTVMPAGPVP